MVPPLLLQPTTRVENAVRHGNIGEGEIRIQAKLMPSGGFTLEVRSPGAFRGDREGGMGLELVKRRVQLAWGSAATFALTSEADVTIGRIVAKDATGHKARRRSERSMSIARAIIVDDELPARQRLIRMIEESLADRVNVVGEAADGEAALAMMDEDGPDLAFIDVQMPGIDGLTLVARMPQPKPYVIFTTAHDRYAIDAFDAGAIDYLLKPFDSARLVRAVSRAESLGMREKADEVLAPFIHRIREERPLSDKLPVTCAGRVLLIPVSEISHCVVEHELVTVHTARKSYTTDYTLAALEARLDGARFFRAHRNLLVNLDHVSRHRRPRWRPRAAPTRTAARPWWCRVRLRGSFGRCSGCDATRDGNLTPNCTGFT